MSTLNVSNITDGTTTVGTSYVVNGSAKVWAKVTYSGGTPIAGGNSVNVSSLTDYSTGNYTVNFSSAFDSNDYVIYGSATNDRVHKIGRWQGSFSSTAYTVTVCDTRDGAERDYPSGVAFIGVLA
jgi:hypothetical protein